MNRESLTLSNRSKDGRNTKCYKEVSSKTKTMNGLVISVMSKDSPRSINTDISLVMIYLPSVISKSSWTTFINRFRSVESWRISFMEWFMKGNLSTLRFRVRNKDRMGEIGRLCLWIPSNSRSLRNRWKSNNMWLKVMKRMKKMQWEKRETKIIRTLTVN